MPGNRSSYSPFCRRTSSRHQVSAGRSGNGTHATPTPPPEPAAKTGTSRRPGPAAGHSKYAASPPAAGTPSRGFRRRRTPAVSETLSIQIQNGSHCHCPTRTAIPSFRPAMSDTLRSGRFPPHGEFPMREFRRRNPPEPPVPQPRHRKPRLKPFRIIRSSLQSLPDR